MHREKEMEKHERGINIHGRENENVQLVFMGVTEEQKRKTLMAGSK